MTFDPADFAPPFFPIGFVRVDTLHSEGSSVTGKIPLPGISSVTWYADPAMHHIVSRNSSPVESGESCKKIYRKYLNYSWPASLARTPSKIQPRKTCALRVCQHDSTCEGRRRYLE